jgi:hypothetical protein
MRISEIINELKIDIPISKGKTSGVISNPNLEYIANGVQAIAYAHKQKPGTVIKVSAITGENDPVYQFLRVCINHKDNPYFPKIYKAKKFNLSKISDDGLEYLEKQTNFDMEPIHNNKLYQIILVVEKLHECNIELLQSHMERLNLMNLIKRYTNPRWQKRIDIATNVAFDKKEFRLAIRQTTSDKQFADAMRIMEPLFTKFRSDLHLGNFMVRDNGELVLNDPIALDTND